MRNGYWTIMAIAGLAAPLAARAQSTFTNSFTLTAESGPTFLMLTWDPVNGFVTRTSGQTTVVYFSSPQPAGMGPAEPAQIASYGYGGYAGNFNGITTNEVADGTVLNSGLDFNNPASSGSAFDPPDNETDSYFGMDYNAGDGNYNFGWVEYSTTTNSFTLDEAYMDTTINEAVTVGEGIDPVPEPSTFALGALSLFSLLFIHRARISNDRKSNVGG